MIKRFFNDLIKYRKYIAYSTKSNLKNEVTGSYLSWMWLFLEPICFMLIYTFISQIVFKSRELYFPIFVFIGLTVWNFFQKTLVASVRLVVNNRDTVTKVYIPKFILLIVQMQVNAIKFFISFILVVLFMIYYQVPITASALLFFPFFIVLYVFTFGVSVIFMHFGVFIQDLANIVSILLRLLFYMSGIFYNIETRVPHPYNKMLMIGNPITALIVQSRKILLYNQPPHLRLVAFWLVIGLMISYFGIRIVYKYENTYVKVMK